MYVYSTNIQKENIREHKEFWVEGGKKGVMGSGSYGRRKRILEKEGNQKFS